MHTVGGPICLLLTLYISQLNGETPDFTYKPAVGLLFTHKPMIITKAIDFYDLTFLIELPGMEQLATHMYKLDHINISCNMNGSAQKLCLYLQNTTMIELNQLTSLRSTTMKLMQTYTEVTQLLSLKNNPIDKRALIPLGGLFKSVFGVAKADDVTQLQQQIQTLHDNAQIIDKNHKSLYTFLKDVTNTTISRLDNLMLHVKHHDESLLASMNNIELVTEKINDLYSFASPKELDYLFEILAVLQRLQQKAEHMLTFHTLLQEFINGFQQLTSGHLPHRFISHNSLNKGLATLHTKLKPFGLRPLLHNAYRKYFYTTRSTFGSILHGTLFLHIKVPILRHHTQIFDMYELTAVNLPIHGPDGENQAAYMKLKINNDYILISRDMEYYGFASHEDIMSCEQQAYVCMKPTITYPRSTAHCEYNIFTNKEDISSCNFNTFIDQEPLPTATKIGDTEYLLNNFDSPITIACRDRTRSQQQISSHAIIELPCFCHAIANNIQIGPRIFDCLGPNISTNVKVSYPINIEFARALGVLTQIKSPSVNLRSDTRPKAAFVNLSQYKQRLQEDLNRDLDLGIDSKLVFQKLKEYKHTDLTKPPIIAPARKINWIDVYLICFLGLWDLALTAALLLLWYHGRQNNHNGGQNNIDLPMMAAMAAGLPAALTFDLDAPTQTPVPPCLIDQIEDDMAWISYSLLITIVIGLLYFTFKIISQYQQYKRLQNQLLLNQVVEIYYKFFTADETSIIYLRTIPNDVRLKYVDLPRFTGFTLSRSAFWPRIHMNWQSNLKLQLGPDTLSIQMPNQFPISIRNYVILSRISASVNYYGCLLIKFHNKNKYELITSDQSIYEQQDP